MRRFLLGLGVTLLTLFSTTEKAYATHLMGGEITWECNGVGEYVFTFKVYRDCSGNAISPNQSGLIQIHNYPSPGSVTQIPPAQWTTVSDGDISPNCAGPGSFSCANGDAESVFEYVRSFTRRLNGTPPAQGWVITYDDVARNANDNLVGQPGLTLRAKILPYVGQVADSCKDNSPQFRELATSLICVGIPFSYNHNATDDELDSLVYEWARPLSNVGTGQLYVEGSIPSALNFQSGYSFTSPFPGLTQDVRNVPATINRNTGEISLTSFTSGKFTSCVKVTAYKCGDAVAEIYRELQANLATSSVCASNDRPIIRPPFQDGMGNFTLWNDTVRAGDLVSFNIQIQDFASIPQTGGVGDSVTLLASGLQFGDNFTSSTTGCINPPCATLTSSLPQSGLLGVSNSFSWQTDCNHTSFTDLCVSGQNTYTFVVTAIDNRCPLPLKNVGTISITVLADSVLESPLIHCVDVQPNGDVGLEWNTTPNINNSFSAWLIYASRSATGPFSLLDSVKTYNTTTYTHTGANAQENRWYYFIRSRSGCKGLIQNVARDTVSTIFIDPIVNANDVTVQWNKLSDPNPAGSAPQYRAFREYPVGGSLNFFQNVSGESFTDNFPSCTDSVRYRVDLVNTVEACTSRSNTLLYQVQFPEPVADFNLPATACPGSPVSFTNNTTISGGTLTYTWDFGDGSPASNQTNPTHTYTAAGNYTVELIAASQKGCADTITKTIDITFPSADAGGDQTICPGGSVQIGGSPTTTASSPTYAWAPAASLDNASIANPTASPTTTTIYTVTVTDGNGCTNTDQVTVNVNAVPTASAGPDQNVCSGSSVTIGGSPTGPVGATYTWNNAASLDDPTAANPSASPTVTTTYTVTVSTGINCSATDQVTITVDPAVTANAGAPSTICTGFGTSIGSVATGGTPNYTYSWSPAAGLSQTNIASPVASPTTTTTYTVTVTDANGCTDDDQVTVTVNSSTADAGGNFTICDGAGVTIGGTSLGTAPLTYAWDNAASLSAPSIQNPVASPTVTTTYTLTVTDANGCTDTDQAIVTVNSIPVADAGADQTICPGESANIGSAAIGSNTYAWDNGASLSSSSIADPVASPTTTTTYTVTVTNLASGCTNTDQVTITVNPGALADAGTDQSICLGQSTNIGGISGGTAPLTYSWSNGGSLNDATAISPIASPTTTTTYTLTITDANGCTDTDDVLVTVITNPSADAGADQTICEGENISLGGSPTGPTGSTFQWDNAASLNDATLANPTANPTVTTTYSVTVTSGVGCSATDQVTITVDPLPTADAGADQTICDGSAAFIGGAPTSTTPGASFAWDNGASLNDATAANPVATPSITTTYTVTVSHPNGCTATDQVVVNVNSLPTTDAGADQFICDGGSVQIGGAPTGPVGSTFAWDNAASLDNATIANPNANPTTTTTYTVTVTDGNGCTDTDQVTVTVGTLPTADAGADQSACPGDLLNLGGSPTGPVGATYQWSPAANLSSTSVANPVLTVVTTETYTVTVTDGSGCSSTDQITITAFPEILPDAGGDQTICLGESIVIGGTSTGGTAPLTFAWDNAASLNDATLANPTATPTVTTIYTLTVSDANGCSRTDDVLVTVNTLPTADAGADQTICDGSAAFIGGSPTGPAGASFNWDNAASLNDATIANPIATPTSTTTYSVTVTNGNGCTDVDQVVVTVDPLPDADAGPDQTICLNGAAFIGGSPTSTVPGATFAWDNAASLNDATSANPVATPTATTIYTVTVSHTNGCTATDQVTVNVNPLPVTDAGVDLFICDGGSAQIGGAPTGPAGSTYAWDNATDLDDATLANPTASPTVTTTFTVTVTDGNGCTNTDQVLVTVGNLPSVDAGADQTICENSSTTIGGAPTGPAGSTFAWDNATSLNDATLANPIASPLVTTTYTVTVTDGSGCSSTDQVVITVDPQPTADAGADQDICDGSAAFIGGAPTSSTPGATFAWDNAASLNDATAANPVATPTVTTVYTVTVTHPNSCTATDQVTVTVNPLPTAEAGVDQTICLGFTAVLGGTPGPVGTTYLWDNAASLNDATLANPTASPTVTTTYTLTVTDGNGCTNTDQVLITVNPNPDADAGPDQTICENASISIGGSPTSTVVGATFAWDNAATLNDATLANPIATPLVTTTYTVTVSHPNFCTATDQVIITVNPAPVTDAGVDQAICIGESTNIGGSPTGPVGSTFAWDNAATLNDATLSNPTATPTVTTTYSVTVTDGNGCTNTDDITITVNPLPIVDAGADQTICDGNSATLGGSPTGPAGSTYLWDNAASLDDATLANPTATPTVTTTYTVTVTDGNGCTNTDNTTITVEPLPNVDAGPDQTICDAQSVIIGGSPTSSTVGATYLWDNAGTLNDATLDNPTASPTATTTYTVTVTHPNGCTATDQMVVNVNPLPVADAGADQDICIGQSANLGGSPTGPAGSTFAWDNAASLNDATLANPTATPTVTTTYTVTVTDGNGCTNTDDITITVNPLPLADAGADQSICNLQSVTIGGTPTSSTPGATFSWDNAASLNSSTLANPVATPTVTTTYTVTVTDPNGCSNTDQVTITVNPLPDADAGPDLTICDQQSLAIGGAPTSTTPNVTYAWDNGASLNDATLANPVANPSITTTYTVTITDVNGCTSTDQMTLTVNPLPTADAGIDQTICEGDIALIGGAPTGPAGATFAWDNAASLDDATLANPTATPTVTTTYTVTVTDGNGCTNTDQVVITVNPQPDADAGADFTICDLSSITIGGSPTSSTPGATFAWDNAATLNDASAANPTANPSTTTTYTVTVTHPNGCTNTDQMTLTVNPKPVVDAGVDRTICLGQSRALGGNPTGPGGSTYLWDNAGSLDDATLANPTATPTSTTTYTVTVTDLNGCTDTDDITITVNPLPDVDAGGTQLFVCLFDSVQLGGSPTSTAPNAFYAWNNPATLSDPTAANPMASPAVTTTYTLTVTDQNGCTNTDQVEVVVRPLPDADAGADQAICEGASVSIGGSPTSSQAGATFLWDNAASLDDATLANPTASPTVTTTYTVTVTSAVNGCIKTDQVTVTVNPLPVANAGIPQTICEGDTITIGGSPTGPANATFLWDNAATLDDPNVANPRAFPTTTTAYVVRVTDANGCENADVILITVLPAPAIDAGPDFTVCQGDSVQLGGSPTSSTPGVSYLWTPADGLSDPTAANPMAAPDDTTVYVVTITDGNACNITDTAIVNVNELPVVDFQVDATCFGDFAAFTDRTSLDFSTIQSWDWDFGDGTGSSVLQNPAYQYTAAGDYTVKLIVTTNLGCIDSVSKNITINALPNANAGPDTTICEGDTIRLGVIPTGEINSTFSWAPGIGLSASNDSTPQAFPLTSTRYFLSVTDQDGCINYDTVDVTVNPLPTIVATEDTFVCKGASLQLNASGGQTYIWTPATYLNDPTISNPIAIPREAIDYVVTGTDANGCSNTDTTAVSVFDVTVTPNDTSICYGDSAQLSVTVDDPTNYTYVWSPSSGLSNTNTFSPKASPIVTTKYEVRVQDQQTGCVDVDSLLLTIAPVPLVSFDYVVSPRCEDAILELTNTSTATDNYLWKLNGIASSEEFAPDLQLDYTVENTISLLGSNENCSDSTFVTIPIATFDEIFKFKDANVFTPNGDGVNDIFNPGFEGEFVGCVEFLVFDRWGDKMFDSNIGQYGWDGRSMKGGNAPVGTYFYIVRIGTREIRGSIYLQR